VILTGEKYATIKKKRFIKLKYVIYFKIQINNFIFHGIRKIDGIRKIVVLEELMKIISFLRFYVVQINVVIFHS